MSRELQYFLEIKDNKHYTISVKELINVVSKYSYLYFSNSLDQESIINQNMSNSSVIVINHYKSQSIENDELHFFIVFRKTVLIIRRSLLPDLQPLFWKKDKLKIFFFENTKKIFDECINIQYEESKENENFYIEISSIFKEFLNNGQFHYKEFLNKIKLCISGYLIQQSYCDLKYDRVKEFYSRSKKEIIPKTMNEKELIEIREIGTGSSFQAVLYYHIYDEKFYLIKKLISDDTKLFKRERNNYKRIKHPFIPKYYGTINIDKKECIVIEFINGKTLDKIDFSQFLISDKIRIIIQLLSVIYYLHKNHFIYRDLKPNNVLIDENQTLIVIDFDRMIEDNNINKDPQTIDFDSSFCAPEVNEINLTNKCDVYSIGKMIYKIIPDIENNEYYFIISLHGFHLFDEIPVNRPPILSLLFLFFIFIDHKNIIFNFNQIDLQAQYYLGLIYYEGRYISRDINKAIYYYSLAANQNYPKAQNNLGLIYYEDRYISRDINKSIHYFSLAANQNYPEAQFNLGLIYYEGRYISRDINKAIYYYSLAANQNDPQAQYILGLIYEEGRYISRDINKSIYYFSLAANQNYPQAQYILGLIYEEGRYILRDINKAIYYYSLAANQNIPESQSILGLIYYEGQYISRDINKSIYYFSLAANQNYPQAQFNLGLIYYEDRYISRDINKAIHYYSLAANQNDPKAQYILGLIYEEGRYISRDINKSIYYYSLAANQNIPQAQFSLGLIYYEGRYISRDINKSIYYFSLAANQNYPKAQNNLGVIYYKGQYILRDINKAIHYFSLAANQNDPKGQFSLGLIYYLGEYISRDINKAIHYFSLAANQNDPKAQFSLGLIYYLGEYISRDINKSIYYFSLAANQNYPDAQYNLGVIYYKGIFIQQDIKRGIYWITQSSNNECIEANFAIGFLYHEGKYMKRNIDESIKYYKKASSFNNQYAKNNLGIIYKNYFEKKYDYSVYFEEAIRQKNDPVSMYNLSHAYIYEFQDEKLIYKSIELLTKSLNLGFYISIGLLCIVILKKTIFKQKNEKKVINIENIKQELDKFTEETSELKDSIISFIQEQLLYEQSNFEYYDKKYEETEFVYDLSLKPVCVKNLYNVENENKINDPKEEYKITADFYEGFGHGIYQKQ